MVIWFIVLHPCLRSHWFATTANPDDEVGQAQAINQAELLFKYVAESYLKTQAPTPPTHAIPKAAPKPIATAKAPSFLASACSFQWPTTATTASILKKTPLETLHDELDRYLRFEAVPISREEGGGGPGVGEPLAEDVLLNPLLWWKVCL